jgi:hypothetical protein
LQRKRDTLARLEGDVYLRITPDRIRARREENELAGRDVMRDGRWLWITRRGLGETPRQREIRRTAS